MASADGRWRAQLCREQGDGARRHPAAGDLLTTVKRAHHGVGTQPQQQPTYTAIPPAQKMPDVRLALMVMRQAISNPASPAVHTRRCSPIRCALLTWCPSCPSSCDTELGSGASGHRSCTADRSPARGRSPRNEVGGDGHRHNPHGIVHQGAQTTEHHAERVAPPRRISSGRGRRPQLIDQPVLKRRRSRIHMMTRLRGNAR